MATFTGVRFVGGVVPRVERVVVLQVPLPRRERVRRRERGGRRSDRERRGDAEQEGAAHQPVATCGAVAPGA